MPILKVNGFNVNFVLDGPEDAEVLTFVHGQAFDLKSWSRQLAALKEEYRVLCIDLRGHGGTELGPIGNNLRMSDFAGDIIGLWDSLGISRSHYIGKSLGGMIGFELALNHSPRLRSLVLVATQGKMPEGSLERMRGYVAKFKKSEFGMNLAADQLLERYLPRNYHMRDPEGYAVLREGISALPVEAYEYSSEAINAMDFDCQLEDICSPTLVIAGEVDIPTPPSRMAMYRDQIKGAKWGVVDGAAHLPNFENPQAFNKLLKEFLDKL